MKGDTGTSNTSQSRTGINYWSGTVAGLVGSTSGGSSGGSSTDISTATTYGTQDGDFTGTVVTQEELDAAVASATNSAISDYDYSDIFDNYSSNDNGTGYNQEP